MEELVHILYVDRVNGTVLYELKLDEDLIPNLKNMRQSFIKMNTKIVDAIKDKIKPVFQVVTRDLQKIPKAPANALDSLENKKKKELHNLRVGDCPKEIFDPFPEDSKKGAEQEKTIGNISEDSVSPSTIL